LIYFPSTTRKNNFVMSRKAEEDTMSATLQIGQTLKGKLGSYTLTHQLPSL
jgi:hypothetical protein